MANTRTFTYTTYIATSKEKVWEALTSEEMTKEYFFGTKVESDWKEGSAIKYVRRNGDLDVQGEILQCNPNEIVTFTWEHAEDDAVRDNPTVVTYKLQPFNETTKVTVLHENLLDQDFGEGDDTFFGVNNGWPAIMSNLKSFMETGKTMSPMDL